MDDRRVRERLDIPRFWWRGAERTRPPAARREPQPKVLSRPTRPEDLHLPAADEPSAGGSPVREAGSRRGLGLAGALTAMTFLGAITFTVLGAGGARIQAAIPIAEQVDQLMIMAGLGVDEISVSGHRYTLDSDIFAALALDQPTSLLRYNPETARRRVEALSWVSRATVTRVLPGIVEVKVTERTPIAVWLHDQSATLVDAEGRQLARVTPSTLPALPRISGAGAPAAAGSLVKALNAIPDLARRVTVASRLGQRRWSLDLENGSRIHLPAEGETEALARLMRLAGATGVFGGTAVVVDLRLAERVAVIPRALVPTSSAAPGAATAHKSASAL